MESNIERGIYEFHWEVTGDCNLKCVYCYNSDCSESKNVTKELSLEEIKKIIDETRKYGTKQYTITGGEPFTRPDIFEIIDYLKGNKIAFLSNGKLLTKEFIDKLSKYPQVEEIKLSWDGFSAHDEMRIGSNWKDLVRTIKYLNKKKIRVVINTLVLKRNQRDIHKLYHWLVKLGVYRWRVDIPFNLGRYVKCHKKYVPLEPDEFTKIFGKIIKEHEKNKNKIILEVFNLYKSEFKPTNTISFDDKTHPCEYKRELLAMKPNGDIIFCPSLTFALSNYRKEGSLSKCFEKEKNHSFYDLKISDLKDCVGCRYLRICGGGCRANAIYNFNDIRGRDSMACATFPYWEKNILPVLPKSHQKFFRNEMNKEGFIPKSKIIEEA